VSPDGRRRVTAWLREPRQWELTTQLYEDDILLLEWKATSSASMLRVRSA